MTNCDSIQSIADVNYLVALEDTFKTEQTTSTRFKPLGRQVSNDSLNGTKNWLEIGEIGKAVTTDIVPTFFQGDWSVTALMANPFFVAMYYDWESAEIVTVGEDTYYKMPLLETKPKSLTIIEQYGLSKRDAESTYFYDERVFTGCTINSFGVSCNAKEEVSLSLDGNGAKEDVRRTDTTNATFSDALATFKGENVLETLIPLMFYDASVTFDSEVLTPVQTFNITLNGNPNLVFGMGEQTACGQYRGKFEGSGSMTIPIQNVDLLKKYMDNSTSVTTVGTLPASLTLLIVLGRAITDDVIRFEFTKVAPDYSTSNRVGELKVQELPFKYANSYAYIKGTNYVPFMEAVTGITAPTP